MRASIFCILISITYVLSGNKLTHEKRHVMNNEYSVSPGDTSFHRVLDKKSLQTERIDKNLLEDTEKLHSLLLKNPPLNNQYQRLSNVSFNEGGKNASVPNNYPTLEEDYQFFTTLLSAYFNRQYTSKDCEDLLQQYCKYVNLISGESTRLKNLPLLCNNITNTCQKTLGFLNGICHAAEDLQVKISRCGDNVCEKGALICRYLSKICGKTLEDQCQKLEDQCKKPDQISTGITTETTSTETTHEAGADNINTHTVIVDQTTYVTQTTTSTHLDIAYETMDCSSGDIEYCVCTPDMPICPEPTDEPESTIHQENCVLTTTLTVENSGETVTTTITITSTPENANTTKIQDKNHGLRIEGVQIPGVIGLVIGLITGMWIIV
ncbi:hypothetical protein PCK1_002900 [Pneumocystis canis]|nr:hypothetical protein PCK1_002900 [Pneumocystis canis]